MNKGKLFSLLSALAIVGFTPAIASANCTVDRPGLIKSAEVFKQNLELLDEALHEAEAPEKVILVVHHFEEGILEFVEDLRGGQNCKTAIEEFQHFHEDVQLLYGELKGRPGLFYQDKVLAAWNRMLPSYVRFQNRLYW